MRTLTQLLLLAALAPLLGACDTGTGPDSGGPDLTGTWTGTFGASTTVRMVLRQSGNDVSGDFTAGSTTQSLTGTLDPATGVFSWGTAADPNTCVSWGSSGLQLAEQASALSGVARRAQTSQPCGSGRVSVSQGTMSLSRAF
ncbi:MAG: hypothetical protein R3E10_12440 [Gemmatimonadota bacterium]